MPRAGDPKALIEMARGTARPIIGLDASCGSNDLHPLREMNSPAILIKRKSPTACHLLKQPVFVWIRQETPEAVRVIGEMSGADQLMNEAIFLGTYPGLTPAQIDQEVALIHSFVQAYE